MHGCLCMCMHFCPLISMASKTQNLRTRPLRPEADVAVNVFHCVYLNKMLIFRGFQIVNKMTLHT